MGIVDDYMTIPISITGRGTLGGDGKYTYDGNTTYTNAHVMDTKKVIRGPAQTEIIADREFWVSPNLTVNMHDRLTWGTVNHEIVHLRVGKFIDGTDNHLKLWVKIT